MWRNCHRNPWTLDRGSTLDRCVHVFGKLALFTGKVSCIDLKREKAQNGSGEAAERSEWKWWENYPETQTELDEWNHCDCRLCRWFRDICQPKGCPGPHRFCGAQSSCVGSVRTLLHGGILLFRWTWNQHQKIRRRLRLHLWSFWTFLGFLTSVGGSIDSSTMHDGHSGIDVCLLHHRWVNQTHL